MKTPRHPARKSKPVQSHPGAKLHPRTARRWRKAGTNPDDPEQVRDRLLDAKNVPEGALPDSDVTPPPDAGDATGPAGIGQRLESDVRHLRDRLRRATGDAVLERAIRRQLLASESELRKFYEGSPASAVAGEQIPRAEVERLAAALGYSLRLALRANFPDGDPRDLALLQSFAGFAENSVDAMRCPAWAVDALRKGLLGDYDGKVLDEWFTNLRKVIELAASAPTK